MLAGDVIATARELRADAEALCAAARATREQVAVAARSRYRRVFLLARGASDGAVETSVLRCPHCQSGRVKALGHVTAEKGVLKIAHRCDACDKPFVFVRPTRDLLGGPAGAPR